ncbi:chromosome partitioning protein ParB [Bacillus wiedmannii]|uniref:ParB/RepB/Spo0J family partition protein n=1 Tax=Bacillus cereus group TaxID=86661 RepID=UPI000BEF8BF0|nr:MULTISPECIES: ParB/RepB/Spo0J family partition protein [Bacillus cereus group]KAA0785590.1 chromosome partitioning protein ParB [Bacillus sp. BB081]PEJ43611.1 chromosome partitioning protein ParB [Bacillus wiedmannii]PGE59982.1 chromosome partitioning protein ParB [Bacillus wiedmannii]PHB62308.1 chromosome partitioning protein ParB [Bacillus wiedmannii]QWH70740.1 chromosome partitioning protein ParB [Bacillus wiedmannii]
MKFKNISLKYIKLEDEFRKNLEDFSLATSIKQNGLIEPLIVEEKNSNCFILVEGYRRFWALKHLNVPFVTCKVEKLTSKDSRVLKRLRVELKSKKKTGYEVERMISFLIDYGYTEADIAKECNIQKKTVKKYINGQDVNTQWKIRAEQSGAGRHGLTEIHHLRNIHPENKEYVADIYIKRSINANNVESIKKLTTFDEFNKSSKDLQRGCINDMIDNESLNNERLKDIVFTRLLKQQYTLSVHQYVFDKVLHLFDKVIDICCHNFVNHLTLVQKKDLQRKIKIISNKIGLPPPSSTPPQKIFSTSIKKHQEHTILVNINKKS